MATAYTVLDLPETASLDDIKKSWRNKRRFYDSMRSKSPDRTLSAQDEARERAVNNAYEKIGKSADKRANYDAWLRGERERYAREAAAQAQAKAKAEARAQAEAAAKARAQADAAAKAQAASAGNGPRQHAQGANFTYTGGNPFSGGAHTASPPPAPSPPNTGVESPPRSAAPAPAPSKVPFWRRPLVEIAGFAIIALAILLRPVDRRPMPAPSPVATPTFVAVTDPPRHRKPHKPHAKAKALRRRTHEQEEVAAANRNEAERLATSPAPMPAPTTGPYAIKKTAAEYFAPPR